MTAPLILATNSVKDTGYDIDNSLRFNGDNFLQRNNPSATSTNDKKGTFSFWFKRDKFPDESQVFVHQADSSVKRFGLQLANNDEFIFQIRNDSESVDIDGTTTLDRVYRDVSSWTHICFNYDTSGGTNGCKLFVNGTEHALSYSATLPQNFVMQPNVSSFANHTIGRDSTQSSNFWTGYLTEFMFVDGQQLAPTEFGEYDSDSPSIWKAKDVTGINVGNLGYYLDFENASSLGNDVSGVGNFTATNCATTDQTTDTCTNNFATINPLDNFFANSTISEGMTKVVTNSSAEAMNTSTFAMTKGKWYFEVDNISGAGAQICGITPTPSFQTSSHGKSGDVTPHTISYIQSGKVQEGNGSGGQTDLASYASYGNGDIIGVYMDLDNMKAYLSKNGTLQSSTGIDLEPLASNGTGHYMFFVGDNNAGSRTCEANFGNGFQSLSSAVADDNGHGAFEFSPNITGDSEAKKFFACCSKNLAEFG